MTAIPLHKHARHVARPCLCADGPCGNDDCEEAARLDFQTIEHYLDWVRHTERNLD